MKRIRLFRIRPLRNAALSTVQKLKARWAFSKREKLIRSLGKKLSGNLLELTKVEMTTKRAEPIKKEIKKIISEELEKQFKISQFVELSLGIQEGKKVSKKKSVKLIQKTEKLIKELTKIRNQLSTKINKMPRETQNYITENAKLRELLHSYANQASNIQRKLEKLIKQLKEAGV